MEKIFKKTILFFVYILFLSIFELYSEAPNLINYQGRLRENGQPAQGTKNMEFRIYNAQTGGTPIWSSGQVQVLVSTGIFSYQLNPTGIDWSKGTYYLELAIEGVTLTPRERFVSVPYAFEANTLSGRTYEAFVSTWGVNQTIGGIKTFTSSVTITGSGGLGVSYGIVAGTITLTGIPPSIKRNVANESLDLYGGNTADGARLRLFGHQEGYGNAGCAELWLANQPISRFRVRGYWQNPDTRLTVWSQGGVRVGSTDADPGINNLAVDGQLIVVGTTTIQGNAFSVGGSTFVVTAGNIGIGTTGPTQRLTVAGNIGIQFGANAFIGTLDNYALRLRTNNADRVYITNTGNIGIGTTAPSHRLRVEGGIIATSSITANGGFYGDGSGLTNIVASQVPASGVQAGALGSGVIASSIAVNAVHTAAIQDNAVTNAKVSSIDASKITSGNLAIARMPTGGNWAISSNLSIAGSTFVVTTSGNVGIGTTNPTARLEVAGQIKITGGSPGAGKVLTSDASGLASWQTPTGGLPSGTSGQTLRHDGTNWVANSVLFNNGTNVGIGTTAPAQKLHVAGKIQVGNDAATATAGTIRWTGTNFEGFDGSVWKTLDVQSTSGGGWTEDVGGNRVYVTNTARNVGIGTTTPGAKLEVNNTISGNSRGGIIINRVDNTNYEAALMFKTGNTLDWWFGTDNDATNKLYIWRSVPGFVQTWDTSGNVGIGTTDPSQRLHVVGNATISDNVGIGTTGPVWRTDIRSTLGVASAVASPANFLAIWADSDTDHPVIVYPSTKRLRIGTWTSYTGTGWAERVSIDSAGNVGIGTTSPTQKLYVVGNIYATGSCSGGSDIRWKKDIKPLGKVLDKLVHINGVIYRWNKEEYPDLNFDDKEHIGLIAQEVEKYFPEVVDTNSDGYKSLDYSRITVILLEAIKEQQKQIEELTLQINKLKEYIKQ